MSRHSRGSRLAVVVAIAAALLMGLGWWSGSAVASPAPQPGTQQAGTQQAGTQQAGTQKTEKSNTEKSEVAKSGARKAAEKRYKPASCAKLTAAQRKSATPVATCYLLGYTDQAGNLLSSDDGPPSTALGPADFQDAYNLPDSGAGMTVAIVDAFGYSKAESDLAVFRDYYGLPPCTTDNGCFTTVDQRGGQDFPPDDPGWSIEAAMDIEAVSSACPKCNILLVQADSASFDDLGAGVDTAASMGAVAISNSYGYDGENPAQTDYDHYYDHPGIAVTVSSGDTGDVQSWPATNPTVVAVGGTKLTKDDSTRGWHESAWGSPSGGDGAGSGCSLYEPRPAWQQDVDTTCEDHKATADISADADPATGLGVYNTVGQSGWAQWGGTSLSSPLTAAMYALAGTPTPGTYPASYPYAATSALNDVTDGANGSCGNKLCEGAPGWDGPTGLGTPNGVSALTQGQTGEIVGTVTDAGSGDPVSGVTITATDAEENSFTATTGDDGGYDLHAPAGTYTVTATKFGYRDRSVEGVEVTANEQVTEDFALTAQETQTIEGYVTDASGHGWPMRAKITVEGTPVGAAYSDPYTGHYQLSLPEGSTYTLHAESADLQGYTATDVPVDLTGGGMVATPPHKKANDDQPAKTVAPDSVRSDIALTVNQSSCTAPGYAYHYDGASTDFEGWTGTEPQDGWTVVDNEGNGQTWAFDDPGGRGNKTGGSGNFAIIDSDHYGIGNSQDSSLVSPVADLSSMDSPEVGFDTYYQEYYNSVADVDVSIDGGQTWTNVWHRTTESLQGHVDVPIPDAANQSQVQVRFHYTGDWAYYWELDNVFIGNRTCDPVDGGLMAGVVRDHNTHDPVNGAKVVSAANADEFGVTAPTPDDANLPDGYYWLFSSHTGRTGFTVSSGNYTPTNAHANVPADYVRHRNFQLRAGHLTIDKGAISVTERLGAAKSRKVTFGNDGTEPVHVKLGEQDGGFTPMGGEHQSKAAGAAKQVVKTDTSVAAMAGKQGPVFGNHAQPLSFKGHKVTLRQAGPADAPWTAIADYPKPVMDDAAAYHDGKVYVVGGSDGSTTYSDAHVYDPTTQSWSSIADLPEALNGASAVFMGNRLYVVGGWNTGGGASNHAYAYDPGSDSWTQLADMPGAVSGAGLAAMQGKLYVVGGCTTGQCIPATDEVYSYDPGSDSWSEEPSYPSVVAFIACGGVGGEVVCAGGVDADTNTSLTATYAMTPGGTWTQKADLPMDAWAAASAAANGKLEVMGGAINNSAAITNQSFAYDPAADEWSALPNSNNAVYRGAAACGLYKVGGSTGRFNAVPFGETLPGYDQCGGGGDVPWLSEQPTEFEVAPGQTVTVRVTMDSGAVSQPGDYLAKVGVATDSPYSMAPIDVAVHVNPPRTWGKITGTVSDAGGAPIPGATVQICTMWDRTAGCGPVTYTLKTDADGHYQLWLNQGYNPLSIIAAKDGYQPQMELAKIRAGETTTVDFSLKEE